MCCLQNGFTGEDSNDTHLSEESGMSKYKTYFFYLLFDATKCLFLVTEQVSNMHDYSVNRLFNVITFQPVICLVFGTWQEHATAEGSADH